ncbi:MAG: hypothetical protein AMK75_03380 [Planctomycetes bacterium SM23_65]|nr:MAG: hypothetical protein AMK75_03380 [Planctomycetes bacterium SM23_65]
MRTGSSKLKPRKSSKAFLVLEDGMVLEGTAFAARGKAIGEAVFYTGVVGYQEVLTDPSYAGTLAVLTYPIIGSTGVNDEDNETPDVHAAGVVIRRYSPYVSNFRATGKLEEFLVDRAVVGIQGVDTRALAVHLRDHGEMKGMIVPGDDDPAEALDQLRTTPSPWEADLVKNLRAPEPPEPAGSEKHKIAVLNVGVKKSCLTQLAGLGCAVEILPAGAKPEDVLKTKANGVLAAGGPGKPQVLDYAIDTLKTLLGQIPILGVGLGHQLLALALGCKVKRMKTGHHGVNHSVRRLVDGTSEITSQHHSFVVDEDSLPEDVEVTHLNVNDRTVEGIGSTTYPAASVQFHPGPDEMGNPNKLFEEFVSGL